MEKIFNNLTCGGPVSVYVTDGKVSSIRPLQVPKEEYPHPWSIEVRGKKFSPKKALFCSTPVHGERNRLYSKDRLLYPMKRVDWDPKGERNPQNRGKSGYVRISWEEAAELVSGEITRISDTYGGHAITGLTSSHHNWGVVGYKMGPFHRFMSMLHYTQIIDNPDSWEGWHWGATHMYGFYWRLGIIEQYDMLEDCMKNTDMIVFWSNDPDSTKGVYAGHESHIWRQWLKELGKECVFIDPYYNYTNALMDGTWLAPRPGSDTCLALAIMYIWLQEDTYDKDYVATRTHGFAQFKDYILGKEDGKPKTCEWAEEESGVPARKIRALARQWAKVPTCLASGIRGGMGSACRTAYGTEWSRAMIALQAMQGLGKPGVSMWGTTGGAPLPCDDWFPGYSEPDSHLGRSRAAEHKLSFENPTKQKLIRIDAPDAILAEKGDFWGDGLCGQSLEQQFVHNEYPIEGSVKMFYRYGSSFMGTMSDTNKWVRMYQSDKLECVVCQDCWEGGEVRFADIILPACTNFERNDLGEWAGAGGYGSQGHLSCNWRVLVRQQKCIEPLGESKSDYEIFTLLAEKLGKKELYTEGKDEDDWAKAIFELSDLPGHGVLSWEEFNKKGYFIYPAKTDTYKSTPAMRWFAEGRACDTPDVLNPNRGTDRAHLLGTRTGLIEFTSESLREFRPDDEERPVVPHYIPSWEGYRSESYSKYPLQIISPHPRFSFHTHYDKHSSWVDEIPYHRVLKDGYRWWPMRINPADAAARNIQGGDIVELYNDRGSVLCLAIVTERVPQGVIHSYGCSAKYDPLTPTPDATDRGGCVNILTSSRKISKYAPGMTPNSCLCEARTWEG